MSRALVRRQEPALSPAGTLLREPVAAWRRAEPPWRVAYAIGVLLMIVGLVHGGAWLLAGGAWEGPVSFRKPFSFGLSFGLVTVTLAWFADRLHLSRSAGWALVVPIAVANASEVAWVSVQRARGVASHFNVSTPLDYGLYIVMGIVVAVVALATAALTVLAFRRRAADPALTLAIRVGLVLLFVAMIGGGAMLSVGNGRAELGQTHDLVRWGAAGNMKVTHALGLHGAQVLAGLAVWLSATTLAEATRTRIVAIAAAGYTGLIAAGTLQWLQGRALLQIGWLDGALWLASALTLAAVAVTALRASRRAGLDQRRGDRAAAARHRSTPRAPTVSADARNPTTRRTRRHD
jgi:hypothetical protein